MLVAAPCCLIMFYVMGSLANSEPSAQKESLVSRVIRGWNNVGTFLPDKTGTSNDATVGTNIDVQMSNEENLNKPSAKKEKVITGQLLVSCVGDSNTQGHDGYSYPAVLGAILGDKGTVQNFGAGGTTVSSWSAAPYIATEEHRLSRNIEADYIVIMFGTNDTGDLVWKDKESFKADYLALVDDYLSMDCEPEIILCTPPTPYQTFTDNNGIVEYGFLTEMFPVEIEAIKEIAQERDLKVVDIYSFTQNHPEWVEADGIHLTAIGYSEMAGQVAAALPNPN